MAFHPDITRKDMVALALDAANSAVRIASRQLTGNAGTVEIPNADGTSTIMGVGAGDTGVAPWVGDTIAPGKPLGITAESHNGAIWVSWDGTLDGGIPADFDHVRFTAVDGSKTVDMGQLTAAGKVTAAELTAGDTVTITAIAYDDAHTADGSSTPNASVASDPVTVVVQSAADAAQVRQAQDNAQSALDKAGQASDTATAAKTTADGKNKIFSAVSEPAHAGLVPGDLWFQLDNSKHVTGIQTWNGSRFVDYLVVANEILVAGSVGTTQIKNGAITTELLTSNAVTAIKIAAQTITGDKLNVGSVASAIMTSNLFKTSGTSDYTIVNDSGVTVYKGGKAYAHLGSDTTYGLQAWNPITSNLTDISSMVFGASSIVESSDELTQTVGVAPKTQNETPWKDLDVIQENGSWKRFRSPSGRFLVVMTIGYKGEVSRDFVYMYANVNFRKNNGGISVTNDYSATSTPGSSTYNMFTPGTFVGIIVVEPNVDYSVNMSFKTIHYNFSDNGIYAFGHCNYRRLFIMPV
jgi:hypothetical protein